MPTAAPALMLHPELLRQLPVWIAGLLLGLHTRRWRGGSSTSTSLHAAGASRSYAAVPNARLRRNIPSVVARPLGFQHRNAAHRGLLLRVRALFLQVGRELWHGAGTLAAVRGAAQEPGRQVQGSVKSLTGLRC